MQYTDGIKLIVHYDKIYFRALSTKPNIKTNYNKN